MLIDVNREDFPDRFMLQNTNHIFTWVKYQEDIFDLDEHRTYGVCDIANHSYSFQFYENEDDEDYMGVWAIE